MPALLYSYYLPPDGKLRTGLAPEEIHRAMADGKGVLWADFDAPSEDEKSFIREKCGFHPLSVTDCFSAHEKPKVDEYERYLFMVTHCPDFETFPQQVKTVEMRAFIGPNYVFTYHEAAVRCITEMREQYAREIPGLLKEGSELLMHRLLALMTANYTPMLDKLRDDVEEAEDRVLMGKGGDVLADILRFKKHVIYLLNIMTEQRDVMNLLANSSFAVIQQKARVYFRDVYDDLMKIQILTQNYREFVSDLRDTQMSMAANRMNEIMKTLTIIATIMMPMTLLVGIYGMNFECMPELKWKYGYAVVWSMLLAIAGGMIWYFRRRKWL